MTSEQNNFFGNQPQAVSEIPTIEQVKQFAQDNYNNGGDIVVECWEDTDIQEYIDHHGSETFQMLKESIFDVHQEYFAAADYFAHEGEYYND